VHENVALKLVEFFAVFRDFFFGEKNGQKLVGAFPNFVPNAFYGNGFAFADKRLFSSESVKIIGVHQCAINIKNERLAHI
jgi:hypothetical protein